MALYCGNCNKLTEIEIKNVEESYEVKGEKITFNTDVAFCSECQGKVFHKELDDKTINAAFSIHRKKHNLLTPSEIQDIRRKYRLSQRALAKFLEWGEVTIHRYESGSIQDSVHNEVLMFIDDPNNMKQIVERNGHLLKSGTYEKLVKRLERLINNDTTTEWINALDIKLPDKNRVDEFTGFKQFDFEKMKDMITYIVYKFDGVFTTKLNKLLWYSDFLNFKLNTTSISGNSYIHMPYGPVPNEYNWILASAISGGSLIEEEAYFPNGSSGINYKATRAPDKSIFSVKELQVLDFVVGHFKNFNCTEIKDLSHQEKAYQETNDLEEISYQFAKDISINLE